MPSKTAPIDALQGLATTATTATTTQESPLGLFDVEEIELGRFLGIGGFSSVYEIKGFKPNDRIGNTELKAKNKKVRDFMTQHARREATGEARYAIKFLQEKWLDDEEGLELAARDLAVEADILSTVHHPNILKIRGLATDGTSAYTKSGLRHDGYFLILDRLHETLENRIHRWKRQTKRLNNPFIRDRKGIKKRNLMTEKLKVALGIASALEHFHSSGLIYRDLKPANIGFDIRDDVKLFDFGLSRDLPSSNRDTNEVFRMSGKVGTMRYMATEVARQLPYNQKADCFAFAHVLWEMLSMEKPYKKFSNHEHKVRVVFGDERPMTDPEWPMGIRILLERAWDPDYEQRPTMAEIRAILRKELADLQCGDTRGLDLLRRRSTFVMKIPAHAKSEEFGLDAPILSSSTRASSVRRLALKDV